MIYCIIMTKLSFSLRMIVLRYLIAYLLTLQTFSASASRRYIAHIKSSSLISFAALQLPNSKLANFICRLMFCSVSNF
jgi:hypothetical protein